MTAVPAVAAVAAATATSGSQLINWVDPDEADSGITPIPGMAPSTTQATVAALRRSDETDRAPRRSTITDRAAASISPAARPVTPQTVT